MRLAQLVRSDILVMPWTVDSQYYTWITPMVPSLSPHLVLTVEMAESQQPGAVLFPRILDEPLGDPLQDLLSVQDHDGLAGGLWSLTYTQLQSSRPC